MSKKIACRIAALLILITISITAISFQAASARSSGVGVGSKASYSLICSAVPAWVKFNVSITKVEGTAVSYDVIYFYSNDTIAETIHYTSDVQRCDDFIEPYIIAANLSAGDQIAEYLGYPRMINQTILMDVAGSQRLVNYRESLITYYYPNTTDRPLIFAYDLYWDKVTGITVKADMYWSTGFSDPFWEGWFNWTLTSMTILPPTSGGGTGLDLTVPLLVGGGVAIVFATVAGASLARRRKRA